MKTTLMAAAALFGGAANAHRHNHEAFHLKRNEGDLVCSEVVQTITGTDFICMLPPPWGHLQHHQWTE